MLRTPRKSQSLLLLLTAAILVLPDTVMSQVSSKKSESPATASNSIGRVTNILNDKAVQEDLGLLEGQLDKVKALREEMFREMRLMMSELMPEEAAHSPGSEANESAKHEFRLYVKSRTKDYEEALNKLLQPHQIKRLAEIMLQQQMKRLGPERVLLDSDQSSKLAELLKLSPSQKVELKRVGKIARERLMEKVIKARAEAASEVLGVLDAEQRIKFDELMGNPLMKDDLGASEKNMKRGTVNR